MMHPRIAIERGKKGGGKDEEGSTSTNDCDYMILCMMLLFMLIKSMLLQKLLWLVRFHPLMLQIVASPGVVATVWDKKPPL